MPRNAKALIVETLKELSSEDDHRHLQVAQWPSERSLDMARQVGSQIVGAPHGLEDTHPGCRRATVSSSSSARELRRQAQKRKLDSRQNSCLEPL